MGTERGSFVQMGKFIFFSHPDPQVPAVRELRNGSAPFSSAVLRCVDSLILIKGAPF